jgi:hypothetical protein
LTKRFLPAFATAVVTTKMINSQEQGSPETPQLMEEPHEWMQRTPLYMALKRERDSRLKYKIKKKSWEVIDSSRR